MSDKWDRIYLDLAEWFALRCSKDPSTKVGAVVVNWDARQEFIGYNGFPQGVEDLPERYADRERKYKFVVHAEVNALWKAGPLAKGATLYVWPGFACPPVCNECAKIAIQAGIKEAVCYVPDVNDPRHHRWLDSIAVSQTMFREAGITWRTISL